MPHIIGLYSLAPQSGKTTLANGLAGHGYKRRSFAGPLKGMLAAMLASAGEAPATIDAMLYGDLKETPAPALAGRTPRHAMQTLGTEWGRECIGGSLWVDLAMRGAAADVHAGSSVVFDDMRFANEAAAVRDAGGMTVCIVRPGAERGQQHVSEGGLDAWPFDLVITNDQPCPRSWVLTASAAIARRMGVP